MITQVKPAPHEQAAKVNELLTIIKLTPKYNYRYWLARVKKFSFGEILEIMKTAEDLPKKYSKEGFIINKLCKTKKASNNIK